MRSIKERLQAMKATKRKKYEAPKLYVTPCTDVAQEHIERVEIDVGPNVQHVRYKWISATGTVIGWYSKEELQAMRVKYIESAELPLAPGVADEIRRVVASIDDALGDEVVPPDPFIAGPDPDQ